MWSRSSPSPQRAGHVIGETVAVTWSDSSVPGQGRVQRYREWMRAQPCGSVGEPPPLHRAWDLACGSDTVGLKSEGMEFTGHCPLARKVGSYFILRTFAKNHLGCQSDKNFVTCIRGFLLILKTRRKPQPVSLKCPWGLYTPLSKPWSRAGIPDAFFSPCTFNPAQGEARESLLQR